MINGRDTKSTGNKRKLDKMDYIKVKNFCASKDTINRVKRQLIRWEKIFAKHISDKGLISSIYKEFLQLNNKEENQLKNGQRT